MTMDEPGRVDAETPDLAAEKLAQLQELFPGAVADGVVDATRIGELVGMPVAGLKDGRERYGLMWAGKKEAVASLLKPSRGTLEPDMERSIDFENARNVFIEGDNLEVLKILQKSYNDQVKLIYIDPPYNTTNDFVYNDDFTDGLRAYLEYTNQVDDDGKRKSASSETTGRRHSGWLSMMYPRLVLARNLLRQDGAICVSIDSIEAANLRLVLDEVFGPENFIGEMAVIRAEGGGMAEQLIQGHDTLLIYARNRAAFPPLRRPKDVRGQTVSVDGVDYWIEEDWLRKEFGKYGTCHYEEILMYRDEATLREVDERLSSGEYRLIRKKSGMHVVGRLRRLDEDSSKFYSVVKHLSKDGKARLEELGMGGLFDFPKPVSLVKSLVLGATFFSRNRGDIILDFFAGSGTTADAVVQLNAEDGGNRRYVLVNLPEPTAESSAQRRAGYLTVSSITLERIKKVMDVVPGAHTSGTRVLRLERSGFAQIESSDDELTLVDSSLRAGATARSLSQEVLLREGVRLDRPWATTDLGGAERFASGGVTVVTDLELTEAAVDAAIESNPRVLVFLEDAFAGKDALKASAFYACKQAGVTMKTV